MSGTLRRWCDLAPGTIIRGSLDESPGFLAVIVSTSQLYTNEAGRGVMYVIWPTWGGERDKISFTMQHYSEDGYHRVVDPSYWTVLVEP